MIDLSVVLFGGDMGVDVMMGESLEVVGYGK